MAATEEAASPLSWLRARGSRDEQTKQSRCDDCGDKGQSARVRQMQAGDATDDAEDESQSGVAESANGFSVNDIFAQNTRGRLQAPPAAHDDGNDDDAKHRKQPPAKAKVGATKTVCKKGEPAAKKKKPVKTPVRIVRN